MAYSTISKPSLHFNTLTYGGNDASGRAITGVGFQPDWCWFKDRSNAVNHSIFDAVRGATKNIISNANAAESTSAQGLQAFGTDGFTLGSDGDVNGNNNNYASWNWKANGQGSSNTAGSINTTYTSVNTTAGFSIVSWTGNGVAGASIGHGLGVVPKMFIVKRLNSTANWTVYHHKLGNTHRLELNSSSASTSDGGAWNNASPTSTVFYTGNNLTTGHNGSTYIAYCFAEKKGYSKFGSYTGNGNADGVFIYTGFKPALVMRKYATGGSASGEGWEMLDSARSPSNVADERLKADSNGAESTGSNYYVDFLSNGFKCRTADNATNNNGATYIYMAFAAEPLVANVGASVPATAR